MYINFGFEMYVCALEMIKKDHVSFFLKKHDTFIIYFAFQNNHG